MFMKSGQITFTKSGDTGPDSHSTRFDFKDKFRIIDKAIVFHIELLQIRVFGHFCQPMCFNMWNRRLHRVG